MIRGVYLNTMNDDLSECRKFIIRFLEKLITMI